MARPHGLLEEYTEYGVEMIEGVGSPDKGNLRGSDILNHALEWEKIHS